MAFWPRVNIHIWLGPRTVTVRLYLVWNLKLRLYNRLAWSYKKSQDAGNPVCDQGLQKLDVRLVNAQSLIDWRTVHSIPNDHYKNQPPELDGHYAIASDTAGFRAAFNWTLLTPFEIAIWPSHLLAPWKFNHRAFMFCHPSADAMKQVLHFRGQDNQILRLFLISSVRLSIILIFSTVTLAA